MAEDGPCGKICNGLVGMLCGIALLPLSLFYLGWNESYYVCEQKRILYADYKAVEVGCSNEDLPGWDTFAFFSCPFVSSTLPTFDRCTWGGDARACSSLPEVNFASVSGKRVVEVIQCKESCSTTTDKDSLGRNVEKKECSYYLVWASTPINIGSFYNMTLARIQCRGLGSANPTPPSWLSLGEDRRVAVKPVVGATSQSHPSTGFKLNAGLVHQFDASYLVAYHLLEPTQFSETTACSILGCVRLKYYKSPSTSPSIFTRIASSGATRAQPMPSSWGCAASNWQAVFADEMEKSEAIASLHAVNGVVAWGRRTLGLVLAIAAIFLCLRPIAGAAGAVGDCVNLVPCGGYVQDMIKGLTCMILCPISTAVGCSCGLFVIFSVWLFMRPSVALAGFAVVGPLCAAAGMLHRAGSRSSRPAMGQPDLEIPMNANYPGVPAPTMQAVPAQPIAIAQAVRVPQSTVMVPCPAGCGPGTLLQIQTPDGGQMQVVVPAGVGPGMQFEVRY